MVSDHVGRAAAGACSDGQGGRAARHAACAVAHDHIKLSAVVAGCRRRRRIARACSVTDTGGVLSPLIIERRRTRGRDAKRGRLPESNTLICGLRGDRGSRDLVPTAVGAATAIGERRKTSDNDSQEEMSAHEQHLPLNLSCWAGK